ncbi:MAG: TetR family transcriptional regulator [Chloroflexi bacterium]|nr:MAG: TetR family transcriptional regulator [Chloroflexota bacterium]
MRSNRTLKRRRPGTRAADSTRERLVRAALKTLTQEGFVGTTARAIARTGKLNQALIFYHFGSVDRLLLAALDATSQDRLNRYRAGLAQISRLSDLVEAMARLYKEDVLSGHITAVQEMVAAGSSVPALRKEVLARMEPWIGFAKEVITRLTAGTVVDKLVPVDDLAFSAVALYFGIETITNLGGDRGRAETLFATGRRFAPLADALLQSATWVGDTA